MPSYDVIRELFRRRSNEADEVVTAGTRAIGMVVHVPPTAQPGIALCVEQVYWVGYRKAQAEARLLREVAEMGT